MKARFGSLLFLPAVLLLLALLLACRQAEATPTPEPAPPVASSAGTAKPLTESDREAIAEFVNQRQAVDEKRASLYKEFDDWRSGLTECHPSAAQEALQEFAASFKSLTSQARNLPRTAGAKELADLLIPAVEAEEAAYRQLRDRWQPGNVSLFEAVEQKRAEAARAQESTEDRSLELQEELEEGPTADEIEQMEEFSEIFEEIEDAWDDYHDAYADLVKKEETLKIDELIAEYYLLVELLGGIIERMSELEPTDDTEDFIETLQESAEAGQNALTSFTEALMALTAAAPGLDMEGEADKPENPEPAPTAEPESMTEGPADSGSMEMETEEMGASTESPMAGSEEGKDLPTLQGEFAAAVEESEAALEEVGQAIEEFVDDKSAEYLADVQDFNVAYGRLVREWESFHEDYDDWRKTGGGCDRVEVLQELDRFSRRASEISGEARGLPRTGFLLPVYFLLAEAAEQEEGAMRVLYNSWRPFAVDAFAAVDQERANADRLRQQANTALQELRDRP